jgi:hypothetical protein
LVRRPAEDEQPGHACEGQRIGAGGFEQEALNGARHELFGWVDLDGDNIPEINDPTPYGRK